MSFLISLPTQIFLLLNERNQTFSSLGRIKTEKSKVTLLSKFVHLSFCCPVEWVSLVGGVTRFQRFYPLEDGPS